ncbi:MAG: DUF4339 domain-containing protein, partial [Flavobacteriales bacterium]|nr:DUF4339 domain-containing protein [Flavobacteriales bacterium]
KKDYVISKNGEQIGPFSLEKITEMLKQGELAPLDYIFDEGLNDWVLLMENKELSDSIKSAKPKSTPKLVNNPIEDQKSESNPLNSKPAVTSKDAPNHLASEWYILKGENKFGPFAYTDVIKMLQQKVVFEFDFAWQPGLSTWVRIADLDSFKVDNINQLKDTLMPEISEVFFRRRHRRVKYGGTVLVHDNNNVWKGKGVEISAGGAGVVMENAMIVPGQTLYLHFKPGDGVPPFNAICEVVSKKYVEGVKGRNTPMRYGLKFTSISPTTQEFLNEFSKRSEAA